MFHIEKRQEPLRALGSCCIWIFSVALTLLLGGAFLAVQGKPFWGALSALVSGGFLSGFSIESTVIKAIPLFLCALGVSIAFRMKIWNIGAEGQFALGAIGATAVVLYVPGLPAFAVLPAMCVAALACGALWSLIPAVLKNVLNINEIITTLMFNYIAISVLEYFVFGPWRDPSGFGFPVTRAFPDEGIFSMIWPEMLGRVHTGLLLCLAAGIGAHIFMHVSRTGFEIAACGENAAAARYARMPYKRLVLLVMALCGAFSGLAGCVEVSTTGSLQKSLLVGYGYTAIVVAWLARLNIGAIAVSSLLVAGLRVGAEDLQVVYQVPERFAGVLEGMLLLIVLAGQFFYRYRIVKKELPASSGVAGMAGTSESSAAGGRS